MIAWPEDGGDERRDGKPVPPASCPRERREAVVRLVLRARKYGLSIEDALAGTGIPVRTALRWMDERSAK